jgi:hypothetical protein
MDVQHIIAWVGLGLLVTLEVFLMAAIITHNKRGH